MPADPGARTSRARTSVRSPAIAVSTAETAHAAGGSVRSPSPVNELVLQIVEYLKASECRAGDRLPSERTLAETLGVGRNSLREALATMAVLRVVEIRPHSGIYLRNLSAESSFENMVLLEQAGAPPDAAEILEMIEVRQPLERQAARLACQRRTDEDLAALRRLLAEERQALREGLNTFAHDQRFHLRVIESAHNSVLLRLLNAFHQLAARRRSLFFASRKRARESAVEHERILEAIAQRDVEGATELIHEHVQRARLYWSEVLDQSLPERKRPGNSLPHRDRVRGNRERGGDP